MNADFRVSLEKEESLLAPLPPPPESRAAAAAAAAAAMDAASRKSRSKSSLASVSKGRFKEEEEEDEEDAAPLPPMDGVWCGREGCGGECGADVDPADAASPLWDDAAAAAEATAAST